MKQADRNIKTVIGDFAMSEYGGGHESLRKKKKTFGEVQYFCENNFFGAQQLFVIVCVFDTLIWGVLLGTFRFLYRAFLALFQTEFSFFFPILTMSYVSGYVRQTLEGKDEVEGSYANERTGK